MSKKSKSQRITFKSIFRLVIFLILVYLLINWFSQKDSLSNNDPTVFIGETVASSNVLGVIYSKLPQDSRYQLENFNQTQLGNIFSNSSEFIKSKLNGFPQKQIKELKKAIIKNISDDMIRNIEEN